MQLCTRKLLNIVTYLLLCKYKDMIPIFFSLLNNAQQIWMLTCGMHII